MDGVPTRATATVSNHSPVATGDNQIKADCRRRADPIDYQWCEPEPPKRILTLSIYEVAVVK
jgi:hypothetical protein